MRLVCSELTGENIVQMFSDEMYSGSFLVLLISLLQSALIVAWSIPVGTIRLEHSSVFYAISSCFEPSPEFVIFIELF